MPAQVQDACSHQQALQVLTPAQEHVTHSQTPADAAQVQVSPDAHEHSPRWQEAPQKQGSQAHPPSESQSQASFDEQMQAALVATTPQEQSVQPQVVQSHCSVQEHSLQMQTASIRFGRVLAMVFISRFSLLSC
ncbi:MAG: hypothetical protein AB7T32_06210 [Dehalococcoidia bacterium]